MTQEGAIGSGRRRPSDAEMRGIFDQIRRLLDALENPRGTGLNPEAVAEQLEAIRQYRVQVIPAPEPRTIDEQWDDWGDLSRVPVAALGLQYTTLSG